MAYSSFEDLEVWKVGCELVVDVYAVFKDCRDFGLRDQVTRAAVSVPSNIAEGAERGSARDFMRFLHISKGSLAELRTQVHLASRLGFIETSESDRITQKAKRLSAKIQALIRQQSNQVREGYGLDDQILDTGST